jgi:hypothetical protein
LIYVAIGTTNIIAFTLYLQSTGLPGGEIGMVPYMLVIGLLITTIFAIIIYLIISYKTNYSISYAVVIYQIIYVLILIYAFGINPFAYPANDPWHEIYQWMYLIPFFVMIIAIGSIEFLRRRKHFSHGSVE